MTTTNTEAALDRNIRLLHPWAAAAWLDMPRGRVEELIETGDLGWAFDIRCFGNCREVRILADSVVRYAVGQPSLHHEWAEVAEMILPSSRRMFRTPELATAWSCKDDHIINLLVRRHLRLMPGTSYRTGPNGAAKIERDSAIGFLQKRRVI